MTSPLQRWKKRFAYAFAGLFRSIRTEPSFWVHCPAAVLALALAWWLQLETWRFLAIILAIGGVFAAELLNTAIETIAKALHPEDHPQIGHALDAAAAAVLVTALTSVVIGVVVFAMPLWKLVQ